MICLHYIDEVELGGLVEGRVVVVLSAQGHFLSALSVSNDDTQTAFPINLIQDRCFSASILLAY